MTADLQHALVALLAAFTLAIPLTAPHVPKWIEAWSKARTAKIHAEAAALAAKAEALKAEADARRTSAETNAEAFTDLRHRLDAADHKLAESEAKHENCAREVEALKRQSRSDGELLEKFAAKIERDEAEAKARAERDDKIIRSLRGDVDELTRIIRTGERRRHA